MPTFEAAKRTFAQILAERRKSSKPLSKGVTTAAPNGYIPNLSEETLRSLEEKFPVQRPTSEELLGEPKGVRTLRDTATPIYRWLCHSWCEEIAINQPGEIWQRLRQQVDNTYWVRHDAPELTRNLLERLAHTAADVHEIPGFRPDKMPIVYGDLPGGHRFAAGYGPNIQYRDPSHYQPQGSFFMSARQHTPSVSLRFDQYGVTPGAPLIKTVRSIYSKDNDPSDPHAMIMNSIRRRDHIILSGPMGAGKTSLLAEIIRHLDLSDRVITLEDTRELVIPGKNHLHFLLSRTSQANDITYPSVITAIKRMTPDVIMAGEVSNDNASTIWELMGLGHECFYTTIHASSTDEAARTFAACMAHSAGDPARARDETLIAAIKRRCRIIQVDRDPINGRHISDVV